MKHLNALQAALQQSFVHRPASDCFCAICGDTTRPLAFHVLEKSFSEVTSLPKGFVPMSKSMGHVRGTFPVCDACAPACSQCHLPIPTEKVLELGHKESAIIGNGVCQHFHARGFVVALLKKSLGLGRFKKSDDR